MGRMLESVRGALRGFRHRRVVAVTIILTLTLGIGANSAIFSMVDAVLLRPLPYPAPDRLVTVYELNRGLKQATQLVAPVRLEEWNRANRSFTGLAGSYFENMTDTTGALPERVEAMRVSPRFFSVLAVPAAIGRTFTPQEDLFGGPRAIVLSDAFWRKRFNGDPAAVGRQLVLTGVSHTIVGVMPASFQYPTATTEMWTPAQFAGSMMRERRARLYLTVGRLVPGVTLELAEADLTGIQTRLGEQFADTDRGWGASMVPLNEEKVGDVRRSLWFLFAAVALVLLAACGNVACLLLADATRREHEVAVRLALGASRATVIRQLLTEGFVLAMIGAALGLLAARWGIDVLRRTATHLPQVDAIRVDGRLVLFTIVVGALTTILCALAPALEATKADPASALTRGGRGHIGGRRLAQRALVATQAAVAIILLAGAGLLIRSFVRLQQVSPGFDPANVLTFRMSASWAEPAAAVIGRQARTLARLEAIPGVASAAVSQAMPAGVSFPPGQFAIVGRDTTERLFSHGRSVSGSYFRTLHIPMLQGATCSSDPAAPSSSKALVTLAFADQFFSGTSPIGHAVTAPGLPTGQKVEITGIVGDVREGGLMHPAEPLIYWCGYSPYWPDAHFVVRTEPSHPVTLAAIRGALLEIEPKRALYSVRSLSEALSDSVSQQRLTTVLLSLFAATAVLLAGVGLYGALSQLVAARRREIGVRMALGARAGQILATVVGQAAAVTGIGILVGLGGALALARFMATLVFGVAVRDPLTFAIVPLVLLAVATVAAIVPARRAAAIDPMDALRED
jgi:putative ABC transport system permease protein